MGFESPIWLLGLLPWGALVFFLLPGKGRPAMVPFLGLWRGMVLPSRAMVRRWPRAAVGFLIAAMLLMVLAAGRPYRAMKGNGSGEFPILPDRDTTMSEPLVAITSIGARALPHPQVMVRIENHSDLSTVQMTVRSDDAIFRQEIELPMRGQSMDRFVDLPRIGKTVQTSLEVAGAPSAWSQAFLVRQSNGIQIAVDAGVDESVQRMAKIYSANRSAGTDAQAVIISDRPIPPVQSGIWIGGSSHAVDPGKGVAIVPHAVTQNVRQWIAGDAAKAPGGFLPLVSSGGVPIVAVRDDSARQVWLNTNLPAWEKTADFVVFFANALDWISGKDQSFTSTLPAHLGAQWHAVAGSKVPVGFGAGEWPGIYESASGKQIAVNAGPFPVLKDADRKRTSSGKPDDTARHRSMADALLLAALGLLVIAAVLW